MIGKTPKVHFNCLVPALLLMLSTKHTYLLIFPIFHFLKIDFAFNLI